MSRQFTGLQGSVKGK